MVVSLQVTALRPSWFENAYCARTSSPSLGAPRSGGSTRSTSRLCGSAFTTALAMLLFDVCYLAHTQAVDVPLAHAGDALGNLWAVCCSPELGRRAHATRPLLPAPTPAPVAKSNPDAQKPRRRRPGRKNSSGKPRVAPAVGTDVENRRRRHVAHGANWGWAAHAGSTLEQDSWRAHALPVAA